MPNAIKRIRELLESIRSLIVPLVGTERDDTARAVLTAVSELEDFIPKKDPEPHPEVDPDAVLMTGVHLFEGGVFVTFSEPTYVRFSITGDPVVPPLTTVVDISPATETQEPGHRRLNGAMLNPKPGQKQGYDSRLFAQYSNGTYHEALNVGNQLPLQLMDGDSLVCVISPKVPDLRPGVQSAGVLTCGIPPRGDFLRSWATKGGDFFLWSHVLDRLERHVPVRPMPAHFPNLADLAERLRFLWLDHADTWMSRYMHPRDWMPDYGREVSDATGIALLALTYEHPLRKQLLAGLVQRGIDWAGWMQAAGLPSTTMQHYMGAAAGHNNGRKAVVALAGLLTGSTAVGAAGAGKWSEEEQFFQVSQRELASSHGYAPRDLGLPEWGTNPARQPEKSDRNWYGDPYRQCCTMNALWGHAVFAHLVDLTYYWPKVGVFLEYAKRYSIEEGTLVGQGSASGWQLAWSEWSNVALDEFVREHRS